MLVRSWKKCFINSVEMLNALCWFACFTKKMLFEFRFWYNMLFWSLKNASWKIEKIFLNILEMPKALYWFARDGRAVKESYLCQIQDAFPLSFSSKLSHVCIRIIRMLQISSFLECCTLNARPQCWACISLWNPQSWLADCMWKTTKN